MLNVNKCVKVLLHNYINIFWRVLRCDCTYVCIYHRTYTIHIDNYVYICICTIIDVPINRMTRDDIDIANRGYNGICFFILGQTDL